MWTSVDVTIHGRFQSYCVKALIGERFGILAERLITSFAHPAQHEACQVGNHLPEKKTISF